jgi:DNA-binding transcriptional LysR family regulator
LFLFPGPLEQRRFELGPSKRETLLERGFLRPPGLEAAAAHVPNLTPARDHVFEHFYFAIQAALEGLGVVMGPLALISEELRAARLLAPINEPALRTRGYFVYALEASSDSPAVAALRKWLVAAGSLAEIEFSTYLSANCC